MLDKKNTNSNKIRKNVTLSSFKEADLESSFLAPLKDIPNPPQKLWQIGQLPKLRDETGAWRKRVAIIGSRRSTDYGNNIAYETARNLAMRGVIIISGMAYGIDAQAHRGCLSAGGTTVAIWGTAIDKPYPSANYALAKRIAQGGAILSEYAPKTPTKIWHFLERNRLVSGLADLVLIVEASDRSGTLTTASLALDQGREVFVVPGNIDRPMSRGCNRLIRSGAQIFTDINDLYFALGLKNKAFELDLSKLAGDEASVAKMIQAGVSAGEEIMQKLALSVSSFNQTITLLEVKGIIRATGANTWQLAL